MSLGQEIRLKRKSQGLSAEGLSNLLGISKDKIYKWESGTKPSDAEELLKIQKWLAEKLENVPHESSKLEFNEEPPAYLTNYREKYIALLEKENAKKDEIISISLNELVTGQRISQAHLKTLLQITVVETAAIQGKDPVQALNAANKVVADNFSAIVQTGTGGGS